MWYCFFWLSNSLSREETLYLCPTCHLHPCQMIPDNVQKHTLIDGHLTLQEVAILLWNFLLWKLILCCPNLPSLHVLDRCDIAFFWLSNSLSREETLYLCPTCHLRPYQMIPDNVQKHTLIDGHLTLQEVAILLWNFLLWKTDPLLS